MSNHYASFFSPCHALCFSLRIKRLKILCSKYCLIPKLVKMLSLRKKGCLRNYFFCFIYSRQMPKDVISLNRLKERELRINNIFFIQSFVFVFLRRRCMPRELIFRNNFLTRSLQTKFILQSD